MRCFHFTGTDVRDGIPLPEMIEGRGGVRLGPGGKNVLFVSTANPPVYWNDVVVSDASLAREPWRGSRPWSLVREQNEDAGRVLVLVWAEVTTVGGRPRIVGPSERATAVLVALGDGDVVVTSDDMGSAVHISVFDGRPVVTPAPAAGGAA